MCTTLFRVVTSRRLGSSHRRLEHGRIELGSSYSLTVSLPVALALALALAHALALALALALAVPLPLPLGKLELDDEPATRARPH